MPKKIPDQILQTIVDLIARHPDGIGIDALQQQAGPALSRRTLQRRLATLILQQRVQSEGEGHVIDNPITSISPARNSPLHAFNASRD